MAYGIAEELPHFLQAYGPQCALGYKVLDKNEVLQILPKLYDEFLPLFLEKTEDQLPPHGRFNHEIPLLPGFVPPFGPIYCLTPPELSALYEWLDANLDKKFIRESSSPAASPILFVKKKEGSLRLCVDYRGLNEGTIKNRYPLPLVKETFMQLLRAKIFTKLDIRGAYNLIRMRAGEGWKTAFRTRYGLFESLVMPFGLTNAPAIFQAYINDTLRPFLDRFCTAYLDDILIYSENEEQHMEHVKQILEALTKAGLQVKPHQCEFHTNNVEYLGFIITTVTEGLRMDPAKITTIIEWPIPKKLRDVRSFFGFGNFYRRFIPDYSHLARPLTQLTKKSTPFVWSDLCQAAFERLKEAFTTAPILIHFDFDKEIVVETDASAMAPAGILSQPGSAGLLHPIAFFSKKHTPAECNYDIYDYELMPVVRAFEEGRACLVGRPVTVRSDHQNL